jgi:hypothetical protein
LLYKPAHEAVLPYSVAFQCEFALRTILAEPESQFNLISKLFSNGAFLFLSQQYPGRRFALPWAISFCPFGAGTSQPYRAGTVPGFSPAGLDTGKTSWKLINVHACPLSKSMASTPANLNRVFELF